MKFEKFKVYRWDNSSTFDLSALLTTICSDGWTFVQANGELYIFKKDGR